MYTWGYIKYVILSKLDLEEEEASNQNLLSRFPYYCNEAMTQICSSIKPKNTYKDFTINEAFQVETMPEDFVRFGDDVNYYRSAQPKSHLAGYPEEINKHFSELYPSEDFDPLYMNGFREASDDEFVYHGYSSLLFKKPGEYKISYDARWFKFDVGLEDDTLLPVPEDILDAIPSYVASQCFKVDDEVKSSIFRNEYELALARIDSTTYGNSKTFKLGGDWD